MIQAAYKKFIKQLPLTLPSLVLAVILVFFSTSPSSIFVNVVVLLAFAWPFVQNGIFILKIEAFRKRLYSLSTDEREEVEAALHAGNSLGDIYFTERFVILHQCLGWNAITLAVIKRTSISDAELLPETLRRCQRILIKTNDSPNVYRVIILFPISDEQLIEFATEEERRNKQLENNQSMKATANATNTKDYTRIIIQSSIPLLISGGLIIVYGAGMLFILEYLPNIIPELSKRELYLPLISGYTYLIVIAMVLVTPIMYFRRKGNVDEKFWWLFDLCMSCYFAWFVLNIYSYF